MGSSRKKGFLWSFYSCFGEQPLCSFLLPRWEERLIDQFDKGAHFCSSSFLKPASHEGLASHSVCDMLVTGYHKNDDSVGPEKILASNHPLGEVEDGTYSTTEGIRGVLVATPFMLMIPGRAEKAAFCSWRGRNSTGRKKEGDAYVCML